MKKQLLLLILTLVPFVASADDSGMCGENITYTYKEDSQTLTISGEGVMQNFNYNSTPWNRYKDNITNLIINLGITSIGEYAFHNCQNLTSVIIPNSVTSIKNDAFYRCISLTSVTIPNSVTSIGNFAFSWCISLTSVTISDNVHTIGAYAFQKCEKLTSVTIPNSVTSIGECAFAECHGLSSVHISDIEAWCQISFKTTSSQSSWTSNPLCYAHKLFLNGKEIKELIIPNSVTTIGVNTFIECKSLTSVTIPNSVTSIGDRAFFGCTKLTSVEIPNSVTTIGANAFCDIGLTSVTIPNSVKSIGKYAFAGCNYLRNVKSYIIEPSSCEGLFSEETYRQGVLYIPASTRDLYTRFDGWKEFLKIVEMDSSGEQLYLTMQSGSQGKIKLAAKRGENYTFLIEPEDGWTIYSVTYNNIDVTNQLDNHNQFTTPSITDNAILSVTYEQISQSIRTRQANGIKVCATLNAINIENAMPGSICQVYSVGGKLLETIELTSGNACLQMPADNIYIVKVGESVFKVGL